MIRIGNIEIVHPGDGSSEKWAGILEKELRNSRIPGAVRRKTGVRNIDEIKEPWLIVVCTPQSPQDPDIGAAIRQFTWDGRYDHILTLLVSGSPEESFPEALCIERLPDGQVIEHEPLAANIVSESEKESRQKLKVEKLRILAPMLGVSFDELRNRRQRRNRRIVLAVSTAVVLGAAAFLAFAVIRVGRIGDQQEELKQQQDLAEQAWEEAVQKKDEAIDRIAKAAWSKTTGIDHEQILLVCLEFLPEHGRESSLTKTLKKNLQEWCAEGYAPVTRAYQEYMRVNGIPEETVPNPAEDTEARPAETCELMPPVNNFAGNIPETFNLTAWSQAYRYAVYQKPEGGYLWIRLMDEPERSHYLRDADNKPVCPDSAVILDDGTLLGVMDGNLFRYDPFGKEYLPLRKTGGSGEDLSFDADTLLCLDGVPWIFGTYGKTDPGESKGIQVLDRKTLQKREPVEGTHTVTAIPQDGLLVMNSDSALMIYRQESLEKVAEISGLFTYDPENPGGVLWTTACYEDGTRYLVGRLSKDNGGKAVYDLNTYERLYEINGKEMAGPVKLTGDKKLINLVVSRPVIWNLETGEEFSRMKGWTSEVFPFGPTDAYSGLRSSSAIFSFEPKSTFVDHVVYEYHEEAIPIPEDLEGQVQLAKELLKYRELTEEEKAKYFIGER